MNPQNKIYIGPLDIVIFHVGGVGGYGPVRKVMETFPRHVVVVCFEANPSAKDLLVQKKYLERSIRTVFVPKCIGEKHGKQTFYVNKYRASSSIFPPAPEAMGEHTLYDHVNTWGENCEVERVTEFDTVTLDELIESRTVPSPDILSMDTQGSEMPIMRGGFRAMETILCVVCEVDFIELYKGQELFCAQHNFLTERGYKLADILNTQYWHPGPAAGEGFLTVGEALYFRTLESCLSKFEKPDSKLLLHKLLKLAAIAFAFKRLSFSSKIVTLTLEKFGKEAELLLSSDKELKPVLTLQQYMQKNHDKYLKNNWFFYKGEWKEYFTKREILKKIGILRQYVKRLLK